MKGRKKNVGAVAAGVGMVAETVAAGAGAWAGICAHGLSISCCAAAESIGMADMPGNTPGAGETEKPPEKPLKRFDKAGGTAAGAVLEAGAGGCVGKKDGRGAEGTGRDGEGRTGKGKVPCAGESGMVGCEGVKPGGRNDLAAGGCLGCTGAC